MICLLYGTKNTYDMLGKVLKLHDSALCIWVGSMTWILLILYMCVCLRFILVSITVLVKSNDFFSFFSFSLFFPKRLSHLLDPLLVMRRNYCLDFAHSPP